MSNLSPLDCSLNFMIEEINNITETPNSGNVDHSREQRSSSVTALPRTTSTNSGDATSSSFKKHSSYTSGSSENSGSGRRWHKSGGSHVPYSFNSLLDYSCEGLPRLESNNSNSNSNSNISLKNEGGKDEGPCEGQELRKRTLDELLLTPQSKIPQPPPNPSPQSNAVAEHLATKNRMVTFATELEKKASSDGINTGRHYLAALEALMRTNADGDGHTRSIATAANSTSVKGHKDGQGSTRTTTLPAASPRYNYGGQDYPDEEEEEEGEEARMERQSTGPATPPRSISAPVDSFTSVAAGKEAQHRLSVSAPDNNSCGSRRSDRSSRYNIGQYIAPSHSDQNSAEKASSVGSMNSSHRNMDDGSNAVELIRRLSDLKRDELPILHKENGRTSEKSSVSSASSYQPSDSSTNASPRRKSKDKKKHKKDKHKKQKDKDKQEKNTTASFSSTHSSNRTATVEGSSTSSGLRGLPSDRTVSVVSMGSQFETPVVTVTEEVQERESTSEGHRRNEKKRENTASAQDDRNERVEASVQKQAQHHISTSPGSHFSSLKNMKKKKLVKFLF